MRRNEQHSPFVLLPENLHMFSFTIAKRLKTAGFPQRFAGDFAFNEQGRAVQLSIERLLEAENTEISIPTLNELIKACGEKFGGLERFLDGTRNRFRAYTHIPEIPSGYADTPEEAVARLWLFLNRESASLHRRQP